MANPNKTYAPNPYYDENSWKKWTDDLNELFAPLTEGTKLAFFIGENDKKYMLLEKNTDSMDVEVSSKGGITTNSADIVFSATKEDAKEMLKDSDNFVKFVSEERLGIFALIDPDELAQKGLSVFFSRLGLGMEQECHSCSAEEPN